MFSIHLLGQKLQREESTSLHPARRGDGRPPNHKPSTDMIKGVSFLAQSTPDYGITIPWWGLN